MGRASTVKVKFLEAGAAFSYFKVRLYLAEIPRLASEARKGSLSILNMADALKTEGNKAFAAKKFEEAM